MEDYVKRMYAEKVELDERIEKLQAYLNSVEFATHVPDVERVYMSKQFANMVEYSTMLTFRLHLHGVTEVNFYAIS